MADLIDIFRSTLQGLVEIHKLKIYHRDLKPQNIIINLLTLKPKIIDFGLSLMIQSFTDLKSFKRCGTMGYMAP
jgi:serine/threonine-protein kinase HSL1 (negative regulator of Swe1 kinase)